MNNWIQSLTIFFEEDGTPFLLIRDQKGAEKEIAAEGIIRSSVESILNELEPIKSSEDLLAEKNLLLEKQENTIKTTREKLETVLENTDLEKFAYLYMEWKPEDYLEQGVKVSYNDSLYEVLQSHMTQANWTPVLAPALFKPIKLREGYEEWQQPTGAHDAYSVGSIVLFEEVLYEANPPWEGYLIDRSPVELPDYWTRLGTIEEYENPTIPEEPEVPEEPTDPEDPVEPTYPTGTLENPILWVPYNGIPFGSEGSEGIYAKDTYIRFEGGLYMSLLDNNHWTPITYPAGWQRINE